MVRIGVCVGLVLSWLVMLVYAWTAFSTLPSAERLQESRMTEIPTLMSVRNLLLRSGAELLVVLALLWPAHRLYLTRVTVALFGAMAWFLTTVPLTVTNMSWVHRRWLAALIIGLFAVLLVGATAKVLRRFQPGAAPQAGAGGG
jgi:hypothetical protein